MALAPSARREAAQYLVTEHELSIARSCDCVGLSRSAYYRPPVDWMERDTELIYVLDRLVEEFPQGGFWTYVDTCRLRGKPWNHKRIHRVYCALGLNQPRHTKHRLPDRDPEPLVVPQQPNQVWSADFMSDALYGGPRFRTFNVIDDYNREAIAIEIDTPLPGERLIRVFERIKAERGLPDMLRVDNGPELIGDVFTEWMRGNGVMVDHIELGKPNQNAFIERFNRTYRTEVLNLYLFRNLRGVREMTSRWIRQSNEDRPHDALGGLPPVVYANQMLENSSFELSP